MLKNRQVLDSQQQSYPKQQNYLQKAPQATNIRGNMTLLPPSTSHMVATMAIACIEEAGSKPFMIQLSATRSHLTMLVRWLVMRQIYNIMQLQAVVQ